MGILERDKGGILGFGILSKRSPEVGGRFTLSHIDMTIRDIQGLIEDEKKADRDYRTQAQNPVIREIEYATQVLLEIADDERRHAQRLEPLLPKLKEKWEEVYQKLV